MIVAFGSGFAACRSTLCELRGKIIGALEEPFNRARSSWRHRACPSLAEPQTFPGCELERMPLCSKAPLESGWPRVRNSSSHARFSRQDRELGPVICLSAQARCMLHRPKTGGINEIQLSREAPRDCGRVLPGHATPRRRAPGRCGQLPDALGAIPDARRAGRHHGFPCAALQQPAVGDIQAAVHRGQPGERFRRAGGRAHGERRARRLHAVPSAIISTRSMRRSCRSCRITRSTTSRRSRSSRPPG